MKTISHIIPRVPFYSQRLDQFNFQAEGFKKITQARYWSSRSCGIACLKMAIKTFQPDSKITLKDILDEGKKIGAYDEKVGWYHQGLVNLAKTFGINADRESIGNNIEKIYKYLENDEVVIASVTVGFEAGKKYVNNGKKYIMSRGGHLVVVFGVEIDQSKKVKCLILHHPSSWKSYEWPACRVDREVFLKSFSSAGNIIHLSKI